MSPVISITEFSGRSNVAATLPDGGQHNSVTERTAENESRFDPQKHIRSLPDAVILRLFSSHHNRQFSSKLFTRFKRAFNNAPKPLTRPTDDLVSAAPPDRSALNDPRAGQCHNLIAGGNFFVLLVGNSVVKPLWLAFVVLVIVAILWFFLRR
jgi:hypothetical protein